jgi:hypothetical protein
MTFPMKTYSLVVALAAFLIVAAARADAPSPTAREILDRVLDSNPWGLGVASVDAEAVLTDKSGATSRLAFTSKSKRMPSGLTESIVRFSAPADLAGAGFLQVQKKDEDDDRFVYLPDLNRARRISGALRASAFMGTDLSFADIDHRDLRAAVPRLIGSETLANHDCWRLDVAGGPDDPQYSRSDMWIRKDNYVPLQMKLYDRAGGLLKSFTALELKRVSGRWFITKSRIVNEQLHHTTEFALTRISLEGQFADDEFTVRALERAQ